MMLHIIFPHDHHQHEVSESSIELSDHHHNEGNEKHNHDDKQNDHHINEILGFLLEGHAHQYSTIDNIPVLTNNTKQQRNVKDISFSLFILENTAYKDDYGERLLVSIDYAPQNYNNHAYLAASPHRGPPTC